MYIYHLTLSSTHDYRNSLTVLVTQDFTRSKSCEDKNQLLYIVLPRKVPQSKIQKLAKELYNSISCLENMKIFEMDNNENIIILKKIIKNKTEFSKGKGKRGDRSDT